VLQVSAGHEEGAEVGPLISPEAKARVERLIQSGADQVDRSRALVPHRDLSKAVFVTLFCCWSSLTGTARCRLHMASAPGSSRCSARSTSCHRALRCSLFSGLLMPCRALAAS